MRWPQAALRTASSAPEVSCDWGGRFGEVGAMSNSSLAARMQEMLFQFENGTLSPYSLRTGFEACMPAMEQISFAQLHSSQELIGRLILAHEWLADPEFLDAEKVGDVLAELRRFIESLPEVDRTTNSPMRQK